MNYGHFTSMQVREGRVHGFELHLNRLASSSAVLFGHALERERVRVLIRHALGTRASASVRVNVFAKKGDLSDPLHPVIEKSQVQVLARTSPVLPMMPGMPERRTHDYVRHGVTSLFAAFNIADGTVISSIHRRHRAIEFKKFLAKIDTEIPDGRAPGL